MPMPTSPNDIMLCALDSLREGAAFDPETAELAFAALQEVFDKDPNHGAFVFGGTLVKLHKRFVDLADMSRCTWVDMAEDLANAMAIDKDTIEPLPPGF